MEQVWAEAISTSNQIWWPCLINLIENEPDLSRSEKWSELCAFLNGSYWKLTRSVLDWWVVRIDSIFIENWQDLSRSEERPELTSFLNDSYWNRARPELDRRVARISMIAFLKDSYCKQTRSELERGVTRDDNCSSWLLLGSDHIWAGTRSGPKW